MNDVSSQSNQDLPPTTQGFPADTPIAPPSDFFPPQAPVHHSKNSLNAKVVAAVFGLVVLAGGLGAGVVLVQQPQRPASIAYILAAPSNVCPSGLKCQPAKFSWGGNSNFACSAPIYSGTTIVRYDPYYCCGNASDIIVNNKCVTGCPTNTTNCNQNITGPALTGATSCYTSSGTKMYCCAAGYSNLGGECRVTPQAGVACNTTTKYETRSFGFGCSCQVKWTCFADAGSSTKTWHSDNKCTPPFGITLPASCSSCFTNGVWNNSCS